LEAWQVWQARAGALAALDEGSRRLLPLVYRNLRRHLDADPAAEALIGELKAIYRKTWFHNQAAFHQAAPVLEGLRAAGVRTLVLKGAALAVLHYRDLGLRPMADVDILVPAEQAPQAFAALTALGWQPGQAIHALAPYLAARQSVDFNGPSGSHFDLHWHALWECSYAGADEAFWAGAAPLTLNQANTLALNPSDQLLHVCVHGAGLNQVPTVRWAADAMMVLRTAEALDWPRLVDQARRLRLSLPLRDTLGYLRAALDGPVPPDVLNELAALPVSEAERKLYRLKISRRGLLGELPLFWQHYTWLSAQARRPATWGGFVAYLRLNWGLVEARQVPGFVLNKARRRLQSRLVQK
jgi:hypothetical protein